MLELLTNLHTLPLPDHEAAIPHFHLSPQALKVPTNTIFFALCLMLMKQPEPASGGPNLLTLRLPSRWLCQP